MDAALRALRDHAARPPARLRAALVARGAALPRGDVRGGELRLRNRQVHHPPRARGRSRACSATRRPLTRWSTTSRTTSRRSSDHGGRELLRPSQGRDARVRPGRSRAPRAPTAASASRCFIPGSMGTASLRAGRHRRGARRARSAACCHGAGRAHEPHARRSSRSTGAELRRAARGAGHRRALPVERGARRGGARGLQGRRPRRRRRRAAPASPARSRGSCPWVW